MTIGRLLATACALMLAGCASSGQSDYGQYFTVLKQEFTSSSGSRQAVTRDEAAAIPYASLGYRIDGGPEHLIVLATNTGGDELWTSAEHVALLTRDGRITRTVGLAHDLAALSAHGNDDAPSPAAALKAPFSVTLQADFPDIGVYSTPIRCNATAKGPETVSILGAGINTIRVDESCRSDTLDWAFTDSFWIDAQSGLVWRSVQHIHPKSGSIETELLRPPG